MKKITALLAASVAGASIAAAEELSISATVGWESDYIFRGVQLAEEYFSSAVDLSYGGFYAGAWAALPVDSVYGNEVDLYAGYGFGLSETVSADVGFTYYTYPDAQDDFFDSDVNTFEIYAGLSFEAPFSPAVYAFYDFDLEAFTLELSGGHSVELSEQGSVDLSLYLGWVDPDGGSSYLYYGAGVAYGYAFTENASLSIFLNWYGCEEDYMGDMGSMDKSNKLTYGISFTAGF
jgi:uncharacterized protein (TIGR02001 family)